jgi:predicted dehydrogenase
VSGYLRVEPETRIDDFADLRIEFPGGRLANIVLAWGTPTRRTTSVIVGTEGLLEIEGDRILLTDGSGHGVDQSVTDQPEDSYHGSWFMAAAADYERALNEGPRSKFARANLDEAVTALKLTIAARRSAAENGRAVALDLSN